MSPDGSRLYVSETSGNRVAVFARNAASGDLDAAGVASRSAAHPTTST
jgi:sugar lactone lactonase YvrE